MGGSSLNVQCTACQEGVIFCRGADKSFAALTVSLWTSMVVGGPWWLPGWEQAGKSLPFSICFLRVKEKICQQGVKWERRQQLHVGCVFWNTIWFGNMSFSAWLLVLIGSSVLTKICTICPNLNHFSTSPPTLWWCCVVGPVRELELRTAVPRVYLGPQNLTMAFYGWCWKGTASSCTAARHLKANYMGLDLVSRLSERFLNGAVADTETPDDDPSDQASLSQMTLRKELS